MTIYKFRYADPAICHRERARSICPYVYSSRLVEATRQRCAEYRFIGRGDGIHWPQVDEDLSVVGLWGLNATPLTEPRPRKAGSGLLALSLPTLPE